MRSSLTRVPIAPPVQFAGAQGLNVDFGPPCGMGSMSCTTISTESEPERGRREALPVLVSQPAGLALRFPVQHDQRRVHSLDPVIDRHRSQEARR